MRDTSSEAKALFHIRSSKSKAEIRKNTFLIDFLCCIQETTSSYHMNFYEPDLISSSMKSLLVWEHYLFFSETTKAKAVKSSHFQISLTVCTGKTLFFPYLIRRPWNIFIVVQYEYLWARSASLNVNHSHIRKKGNFCSSETSK